MSEKQEKQSSRLSRRLQGQVQEQTQLLRRVTRRFVETKQREEPSSTRDATFDSVDLSKAKKERVVKYAIYLKEQNSSRATPDPRITSGEFFFPNKDVKNHFEATLGGNDFNAWLDEIREEVEAVPEDVTHVQIEAYVAEVFTSMRFGELETRTEWAEAFGSATSIIIHSELLGKRLAAESESDDPRLNKFVLDLLKQTLPKDVLVKHEEKHKFTSNRERFNVEKFRSWTLDWLENWSDQSFKLWFVSTPRGMNDNRRCGRCGRNHFENDCFASRLGWFSFAKARNQRGQSRS